MDKKHLATLILIQIKALQETDNTQKISDIVLLTNEILKDSKALALLTLEEDDGWEAA